MINFQQRNRWWLAAIGGLTTLALLAGSATPAVGLAVLGGLGVAVAGSFIQLDRAQPANLIGAFQQRTTPARDRISPQAREALERATSRGSYIVDDVQLLDIGLIATYHGEDGMAMRRTRSVSKDDDGVRPFITLDVSPSEADRNMRLRYELIDQNGEQQFVHDMTVFLRDGEMNILSDNQLPLSGNDTVSGMGAWDLRVYLDDQLLGIHTFTLAPSYEDRRNRLNRNEAPSPQQRPGRTALESNGDDAPMTLEDLLRNQQNRGSSSR